MSKAITITPSLTFGKGAEEAAQFYVSVFSEVFGNKKGWSKILRTTYFGEEEGAIVLFRRCPHTVSGLIPPTSGFCLTFGVQ
jgi:hypothetical protein